MILQVEKFQDLCKKILCAVDTDTAIKNVVYGYDTVELEATGKVLHLNVSNGEYFVSMTLDLDEETNMRAVVDANLFLTLISKITTKTVELSTTENALVVKANGTYKFPLKYDVNKMVELPKILINNPTTTFVMQAKTLASILTNNSREIDPKALQAVKKMYYLDGEGCVTFTQVSACVNSFTLPENIKIVLTPKLVKLFKLFVDGDVKVTLGFEEVGSVLQTRICLEQGGVTITSILPSDQSMLETLSTKFIPALRTRTSKTYPHTVSFDKKYFLEALDRLLLFDTANSLNKGVGVFDFNENAVTIFDNKRSNNEVVAYVGAPITGTYTANLDLLTLREMLSLIDAQMFTLSFGDNSAVIISNGIVKNVLCQSKMR